MKKAPQPPLLKNRIKPLRAEIDFEAWKNRLIKKGIKGDVDSIINRAKGTKVDALAAQGELCNLERYLDAGCDVFVLTPPSGIGVALGTRTAEAIIKKGGVGRKLEIKTATKPPVKTTWSKHIDRANKQIKQGSTRGIITLDFSAVTLQRGKGCLSNQNDIEALLANKMWGNLSVGWLRNVDQLEAIYFDTEDGKLKRSAIERDQSGETLLKTEVIE